MAIIYKRADELKEGDLLAGNGLKGHTVKWIKKTDGPFGAVNICASWANPSIFVLPGSIFAVETDEAGEKA